MSLAARRPRRPGLVVPTYVTTPGPVAVNVVTIAVLVVVAVVRSRSGTDPVELAALAVVTASPPGILGVIASDGLDAALVPPMFVAVAVKV